MTRLVRQLSIGALCLVLASAVAFAQGATAQLNGKVSDSSGAVLPGVTVTATQTDTGFTRTTVTDGTGSYVLPNLPTGPYKLEATLEGFRTYSQTGIVLQVAANPTINVAMALGDLAETVSVEAAAPLVDVRTAGISDVVENERIVELPLQGRQVTSLLVLAGAAVDTGLGNSNPRNNPGTVSISVGGGLAYGVAYFLDGAMHNDPYNNLNLPLPFPDALQEFSVATSGLSAQNGMHSGASVNAVTKSGTNRFSGNAFDFMRDHRFNATNPFAVVGKDGKRVDDGLSRHQYGGTLGGPIAKDRLFFFGAYQGTRVRQTPSANIAYVPTASMLNGDFTAFASPACNAGRQVTLRGPFVNNQINPALFSPAAVAIAKKLPVAADPCGQVTYGTQRDSDEWQGVAKVDFQISSNHSLFGRYMHTKVTELPVWDPAKGDLLTTGTAGGDRNTLAQSLTFGDTKVFGPNVVNAARVVYNRSDLRALRAPFLDAPSVGSKVFTYIPGKITLVVNGGFNIGQADSIKSVLTSDAYQFVDDLTLVRGAHQMAVGASVAYWKSYQELNARSGGQFTFNGGTTGLGLADFLTGSLFRLEQGAPGILPMNQTYVGLYAQDTWRATSRVTVNAGMRWEPYSGMNVTNGAVSNFSVDNFTKGVKSTVYRNAPAGLLYPGDAGFPSGKSGINRQWFNFSPRAGLAWDVHGDGRLAFRSSWGLAYDFPSSQYHFINASAAPFANRLRVEGVSFDDPYRGIGGNPFPIPAPSVDVPFPAFGSFGSINPDINSTRVQTWNVTVEQQFGADWQASASYLGNYMDHLWNQVALNPGQFLGLGPCTIAGVNYPVCSTAANLDQRRVLYAKNPKEAQFLGPVDQHTDVGTQSYRGLKLSFRRRSTEGVSLTGNYTWSYCVGNTTPIGFSQISAGYLKPDDPSFDRGNCQYNRTHVGNFTIGWQTPTFSNAGLRAVASDWRASGIVSFRSGPWLSITTARDIAFTGISGQRLNVVKDDPYGDKTINNFLNPAAFAYPANGTLGNSTAFSVKGPGYWNVDLSLSRVLPLGGVRNLELRAEAFNLFNRFNWGAPITNYDLGTFGKITSLGADPRIMQFAVKFGF